MIFPCPECQKRIALADYFVGRRTICPYCETTVDVPKLLRAIPAEPAPPLTWLEIGRRVGVFIMACFFLFMLAVFAWMVYIAYEDSQHRFGWPH